jgi:double zinc ribbon protein
MRTDNREGRKFCTQCGSPLKPVCPACGAGTSRETHPDPFVDYLFDLDEPEAVDAVARMRRRLRAPSLSADDFIDSIAQVGMPLTTSRLRNLSNRI